MNRFWLLLAFVSLSACSTVMDRTTQEVKFETPGARESMCWVNTGEVMYKVSPPQKVILMKTDDELEVRCLADGNREKTVMIRPVLSNNTLLNVGNGFVPGFSLDEHTKAHYLYPDLIAVDFTNIPFKKADQPSYAQNPVSPDIENLDLKKGGFPAIYNSDLIPPSDPEPRQSRSFYSATPDALNYQPSKPPPIK